jgi:hypothetical protein
MTKGKRIALVVAVLVIAVVGFIVLKPDSKKKTSTVATNAQTTTGPGQPARPKPKPEPIIRITVENGKPVGGVNKINVDKGDDVKFAVVSDVADEIHVHGYDLMKRVEAGGRAEFSFKAKMDGIYEIELEEHGEQIAELQVNP